MRFIGAEHQLKHSEGIFGKTHYYQMLHTSKQNSTVVTAALPGLTKAKGKPRSTWILASFTRNTAEEHIKYLQSQISSKKCQGWSATTPPHITLGTEMAYLRNHSKQILCFSIFSFFSEGFSNVIIQDICYKGSRGTGWDIQDQSKLLLFKFCYF